jgi:hypothetical protein
VKQIKVRIHKGETTVSAEGFPGNTCKDATKLIEEALGQVTADEETHEVYQEIDHEFVQEG